MCCFDENTKKYAMDTIKRTLHKRIVEYLKPGQKAALIFGARRVGKTILIRQLLKTWQGRSLLLNGEDWDAQALLEPCSVANYRRLLEGIGLLAIDSAQNIPNIGQKIKLIVDEIPHIHIIAAGFSSSELLGRTGEPLVGRSAAFHLHAFSQRELAAQEDPLETRRNLETRLIYGSYPEAVLPEGFKKKTQYLKELVNTHLLKDILIMDGLKNVSKLGALLRFLAQRLGEELSYDEIGRELGMSKNTAEKYLNLLSGAFVLYRLGPYTKNLRKEVSKPGRWYFHDNGIRNALAGGFNPLNLRADTEALWKNYLLGEEIKERAHNGGTGEFYFWRTYDHQALDLVEDSGIQGDSPFLAAFNFHWGDAKKPHIPPAFAAAYPQAAYRVITRENYLEGWIS